LKYRQEFAQGSCDEHALLQIRASVQYQRFFFGRLPQAKNTGKLWEQRASHHQQDTMFSTAKKELQNA
jgi:hypothetical protein